VLLQWIYGGEEVWFRSCQNPMYEIKLNKVAGEQGIFEITMVTFIAHHLQKFSEGTYDYNFIVDGKPRFAPD
jgi:hypothetical protein